MLWPGSFSAIVGRMTAQEGLKSNATEAQNKWARAIKSQVEVTGATALKLRLIPPGEFLMGSTDADIDGVLKRIRPAGASGGT